MAETIIALIVVSAGLLVAKSYLWSNKKVVFRANRDIYGLY